MSRFFHIPGSKYVLPYSSTIKVPKPANSPFPLSYFIQNVFLKIKSISAKKLFPTNTL